MCGPWFCSIICRDDSPCRLRKYRKPAWHDIRSVRRRCAGDIQSLMPCTLVHRKPMLVSFTNFCMQKRIRCFILIHVFLVHGNRYVVVGATIRWSHPVGRHGRRSNTSAASENLRWMGQKPAETLLSSNDATNSITINYLYFYTAYIFIFYFSPVAQIKYKKNERIKQKSIHNV